MKFPFLALLLIVNLLACPVCCLACETKGASGEESVPAACACCSHCDQTPVSETPEPCGDACNCQNCICEGAIVDASFELLGDDFLVSWLQSKRLASHLVAGKCDFSAQGSFDPGGQLLCGRDRCVAHQAWLI